MTRDQLNVMERTFLTVFSGVATAAILWIGSMIYGLDRKVTTLEESLSRIESQAVGQIDDHEDRLRSLERYMLQRSRQGEGYARD